MASAKKKTVSAPVSVDGALLEAADARQKRERVPRPGISLVSDFGTKPAGTTHWKCRRVFDDGTKEILKAKSKETAMVVEKWPIEELHEDTIKSRWGAGRYQVEFMGSRQGKGTCVHLAWGARVEIGEVTRRRAAASAAPAVAAQPATSVLDPFAVMAHVKQQAREEADHIEALVNGQMSGLAQLAAVLAGNNQAAQQIAAAQQNGQIAQAINAVVAAMGSLETRLAAIEGADEEDDDDEEDFDDEDDEEEDDDEAEEDMLEMGMRLIDKYGPAIQLALAALGGQPALNGAQTQQAPAAAAQPTSAT